MDQFGGVIRWMRKFVTLRSIVLTGSATGMHAAFDPPKANSTGRLIRLSK